MPLTPFEIATSKIWANGLVIVIAAGLSLYFVVRGLLGIPIAGSIPLFLFGVAIYLFFATAVGIFLGTVARSMPQLGLLYLLVFLPLNMLSGSNTPLESMPPWLSTLAQASPTTHFVSFAQAILYRGAGFAVVAAIRHRRAGRSRIPEPSSSALPQGYCRRGVMRTSSQLRRTNGRRPSRAHCGLTLRRGHENF
jgi:hypothetical protein